MNIPQGHQAVMPYLMLKNASGFIGFCRKVFAAELHFVRYRDSSETVIMHAEVLINGGTVMFCEATEAWEPHTANMFVYVPDADEACLLAQEAGAQLVMEPEDKEYGRSGGVKDPFGNTWWITSVK